MEFPGHRKFVKKTLRNFRGHSLPKKNPQKILWAYFWKYIKSKTTSKEPISDLKYADSHGNVHVASTDDSKAEALCNFFSSVFINADDNPFKYLEKKL